MGWSRMPGSLVTIVAVAVVGALALPRPAVAQDTTVTIAGDPVVGSTLTATLEPNDPDASYIWQRCQLDETLDCVAIEGVDGPSYTIVDADLGKQLAVVAELSRGPDVSSARTSVVMAPPPPPPPPPDPTPEPTPTPSPVQNAGEEPPTFDQSGGTQTPPAAATAPASHLARPQYLWPFPVVRVKGTLVAGGARISLLRITAPATARTDVRCSGPGCRMRRHLFGTARLTALERFLRARTRITIRVSSPESIGKYVRLVIRNGSPPKRRDACLLPGETAPVRCPVA
jgi:hypothetical protein